MNLSFSTDSWSDIISQLNPINKNKTIWSIIRRLVFAGTVYHIWRERNLRIFTKLKRSHHAVVNIVKDDIRCRLLSLSLKTCTNVDLAKTLWTLP